MKWIFNILNYELWQLKYDLFKLKYDLFYKFGRKYKYCFDCLMNYKLTNVEWKYMRCYKCQCKFSSGKQG